MGDWLAERAPDILTLQEVRASDDDLRALFDDGWHLVHDEASAKGRSGVAVLSRTEPTGQRTALAVPGDDTSGRWVEADVPVGDRTLTVVSAYAHSGEADTPKQEQKYRFLDAMTTRLAELGADGALAVVTGDLNVGHRTLDIKNWKGNLKNAGFLPEERAKFDAWLGAEGDPAYNAGAGLGWVDVGRAASGEVAGPYTWWSWRGKAFDLDSGWRIDYHLASPALASTVTSYTVDRAPTYAERWSDHAPVVVEYAL